MVTPRKRDRSESSDDGVPYVRRDVKGLLISAKVIIVQC